MEIFSEWITLAVRTDGNFFGMDDERLVHGFPCKNGKPLRYYVITVRICNKSFAYFVITLLRCEYVTNPSLVSLLRCYSTNM